MRLIIIQIVRVKNDRDYYEFCQSLISEVVAHNIVALLSMEEIKSITQVPLKKINYIEIH